MPLYEYQCEKCAHRFEKIQKFSDKPIKKCPECGGPVKQLLSPPAVQFKGSGWYVTDYAKKPSPPSSTESASGDAKKESKAEISAKEGAGKETTAKDSAKKPGKQK
jgi:putative FmdB family regulatory protein